MLLFSDVKKDKKNPMYGKHHTLKSRLKISLTRKNKITKGEIKVPSPMLGKHHTKKTIEKMRLSNIGKNKGEKHGNWKGDDIKSNTALHNWVRRNFKMPDLCQLCNKVKPYDLANITGTYGRDITNWAWYCRRCHMVSDGRLNNLVDKNKNRSEEHRKRLSIAAKIIVKSRKRDKRGRLI